MQTPSAFVTHRANFNNHLLLVKPEYLKIDGAGFFLAHFRILTVCGHKCVGVSVKPAAAVASQFECTNFA